MSTLKNIFLIDDDDIFIFLSRKNIAAANRVADITEFGDGESALDFLKNNIDQTELLPDLIFLDLSMPIMDGWEFLKEYTLLAPSITKKIVLYIVSSSISPHDIDKAKQFSVVTDFVIKPLAKEKFISIFDKL